MFNFDNSYARELEGFYVRVQPDVVPKPQLLALNEGLAQELGLDVQRLRKEVPDVLGGRALPEGAEPLAQVYAGHQFGHFSGRLGDGRALLLGEIFDREGNRQDVHLKGSGATPYSRGGDGKAAIGPVLREYLMGEAMHALGVPTTRVLAAIGTGEMVMRDEPLQGAVLARVAASHLRVGTFEYAAATGDHDALRRLLAYALRRHVSDAPSEKPEDAALMLLEHVARVQADLIAGWMAVGFIHGVMNTDNMTISGETIDYGPCAFMDAYDPATVFSSIDRRGRYAFGNQPAIGQWNLVRLALALAPLFAQEDEDALKASVEPVLVRYVDRFESRWLEHMQQKLGLAGNEKGDRELVEAYLNALEANKNDYTSSFRSLANDLRKDATPPQHLQSWWPKWIARHGLRKAGAVADAMDAVNPIYVPRNHLVEAALAAARTGDLSEFDKLLGLLRHPFDAQPDLEAYAAPAPASFYPYQTFCGT